MAKWDGSNCCCHVSDAYSCYRSRNQAGVGDLAEEDEDDCCECACHAKYREALIDEEEFDA